MIRVRLAASALLTAGIVLLLLTAGCADVTTTQKVGDFGTTFGASSDEQKAIDWFRTTYGDPMTNNDQPARFVEPLVTTGLDTNKMPKDKVTTFPQSGGSVYFFVIYDNFKKGDPITVSWLYVENGREVTKVEKQAGGDFGRFIIEFQKPDSGWGKGRQKLMISGDGASASVDFTIGDALQTTPLPYTAGSSATKSAPAAQATGVMPLAQQTLQGSALTTIVGTPASTPVIDTQNDPHNCGKVGNVCPNVYNAKTRCNVGTCLYSCIPPWTYDNKGLDAPVDPNVGCTLNSDTDPKNCGGFGYSCQGSEKCEEGTCVSTCSAGKRSCGDACVDLKTDIYNCGSCGHVCPLVGNMLFPTNVDVRCEDSQCNTNPGRPIVCLAGYDNCDGDPQNGCEADLSGWDYCGKCGVRCSDQDKCVVDKTNPKNNHCEYGWGGY